MSAGERWTVTIESEDGTVQEIVTGPAARVLRALRSREGDGVGGEPWQEACAEVGLSGIYDVFHDAADAIRQLGHYLNESIEAVGGVPEGQTLPSIIRERLQPPAPQPPPSLDAWVEEPRTGAETRAEAARRLGDLAARLSGEDRLVVAFASGMLSGPQPAPEAGEVERHGWEVERGVTCVACPDCAFTFDADHENGDGSGYSCPVCVLHRRARSSTPDAGEVDLDALAEKLCADAHASVVDGSTFPDSKARFLRTLESALRARSEGAGWRPIETALRAEVDRATVEAGTRGDMRWSVGYVAGLNYARNLLRPLPAPPVTTEVDDG